MFYKCFIKIITIQKEKSKNNRHNSKMIFLKVVKQKRYLIIKIYSFC